MSKKKLTLDKLNKINELCQDRDDTAYLEGANKLCQYLDLDSRPNTAKEAVQLLTQFFQGLLKTKNYLAAATFLFGRNKFDGRAYFARRIFEHIPKHNKIMIPGSSSSSKTYSAGVLLVMEWIADPHRTKVRLCSMDASHLRSNLFSHMIDMLECSILDLGIETSLTDLYIGMNGQTKRDNCILGVTFKSDNTKSSGKLKGIKPTRLQDGGMGKVRILIDEGQNVSPSVYKDFSSPESSMHGPDRVKIIVAGNPEDVNSAFGQWCEPINGWSSLDLELSKEWTSKKGYFVLRMDGADCENVQEQKEVYEGFMSYETYRDKLLSGDTSPEYWTFARGMFPLKSISDVVIRREILSKAVCDVIYPGNYIKWASVDLATDSGRAGFAFGRWGVASGRQLYDGSLQNFIDSDGNPLMRHMLSVDQVFPLDGWENGLECADRVIEKCKELGVPPEWLVVDATGNQGTTMSYLKRQFGDVLGAKWAEVGSEVKILAEDESLPKETCHRLSDELWLTAKHWLEFGAICISPTVEEDPFFRELSTRRVCPRHKNNTGKFRVETKPEWKHRNGGQSPDLCDSFLMAPYLVRMRGDYIPGMMEERAGNKYDRSASIARRPNVDHQTRLGYKYQPKQKTNLDKWLDQLQSEGKFKY